MHNAGFHISGTLERCHPFSANICREIDVNVLMQQFMLAQDIILISRFAVD